MQTVSSKKYLGFSIIQKAFFVMVEQVASIVLRVFYMEFYDSEKISKKALKVLSKFNTDSSLKWLMNNVPFNILSGCKEARNVDGGIRFASDKHKYEALYLDGQKPMLRSIALSGNFRLYCDDMLVVQTEYDLKAGCEGDSEIFWNWHSVAVLRLSSWVEDIPALVHGLKGEKEKELSERAEREKLRPSIFERNFDLGQYGETV